MWKDTTRLRLCFAYSYGMPVEIISIHTIAESRYNWCRNSIVFSEHLLRSFSNVFDCPGNWESFWSILNEKKIDAVWNGTIRTKLDMFPYEFRIRVASIRVHWWFVAWHNFRRRINKRSIEFVRWFEPTMSIFNMPNATGKTWRSVWGIESIVMIFSKWPHCLRWMTIIPLLDTNRRNFWLITWVALFWFATNKRSMFCWDTNFPDIGVRLTPPTSPGYYSLYPDMTHSSRPTSHYSVSKLTELETPAMAR